MTTPKHPDARELAVDPSRSTPDALTPPSQPPALETDETPAVTRATLVNDRVLAGHLSVRTQSTLINRLPRAEDAVPSLGDLFDMDDDALLRTPDIGPKSLGEIRALQRKLAAQPAAARREGGETDHHTPKGFRRIAAEEVWVGEREIVVLGTPSDEEDENHPDYHNCDVMGCGSLGWHVVARSSALAAAPRSGDGETTCRFARSDMTPCVVRDGEVAASDAGECVGCGWSKHKALAARAALRPAGDDHG